MPNRLIAYHSVFISVSAEPRKRQGCLHVVSPCIGMNPPQTNKRGNGTAAWSIQHNLSHYTTFSSSMRIRRQDRAQGPPPFFFVLQDCLEEDSERRLEGVMLARNSGMNTGRLLHALILVVFGAMGTCTCILGLLISRDKTTLR